MTLVNRVSAFFLAALAVALVGYSLVMFVLVRDYLYRQFDDELHAALQILTASVEVEPDDAKWHPAEHGINLSEASLGKVLWVVCDERGEVIDRSPRLARGDAAYEAILPYARQTHQDTAAPVRLGPWRAWQRELSAPQPKPLYLREPHEFANIRITVASSVTELNAAVNRLLVLVTVLPAAVWLLALCTGRWFIRKALTPVRAMAASARSMTQADFGPRLVSGPPYDELAELGASFNHLLDRLQTAFERERRFTGDAAHQLRTPLAVLQVQLDVARRKPRDAAEYQRLLDVLAGETSELRQIVESLLFLARSAEDAIPPERQRVDLSSWLVEHCRRWDEHARSADLHVETCGRADVWAVLPLLGQAVDNLVSNAFKYSQAGTPIEVSVERQGQRIELHVRDRGIGIAAKDQQEIFAPFHRTEAARMSGVPGTGLGLSVCQRIAVALGGELSCTSDLGRGTTFTLSLPAAAEVQGDGSRAGAAAVSKADFSWPSP